MPLYTLFEHPFLGMLDGVIRLYVAVLGAHAAFVGSPPTEVEIFIWIMSPLYRQVSFCYRLRDISSIVNISNFYTECTAASGAVIYAI